MSTSRACLVTGYLRLDLPNRSHGDYEVLGARMLAAANGVEARVYGSTAWVPLTHPQTTLVPQFLEDCWHWQLSDGATLPAGNPGKDTRAFFAVQHEKTAWVADAAERTDAEILVWLDYGLLHVPGITEAHVASFLARAATDAPRDRVGMASIWGFPGGVPGWSSVGWWCAGGAFTCPRYLARPWHEAVVERAVGLRSRGFVTWEVNDWAAAWLLNPGMVRAWRCDHDATLLEAGP